MLSFFSIFEIRHNQIVKISGNTAVVNCFHFSVSLRYDTTSEQSWQTIHLLWIAFIFQYLWDTTQPNQPKNKARKSCELLSFFSIFEIRHNYNALKLICRSVVNCFHFSVSLRYDTTCSVFLSPIMMLWIAFIFQYLWDTTQHPWKKRRCTTRCELLSFFSIFEIRHN